MLCYIEALEAEYASLQLFEIWGMKTNMIYVTSDIHGRFDLFKEMLKLICFAAEDTMYVLGDVVDRGSEPVAALAYIKDADNIVMLKGNHEEMMMDYFINGSSENWFMNGGRTTYKQFVECGVEKAEEILNWVHGLKYTHKITTIDQGFGLVHAGLKYNDGVISNVQSTHFMTWAREEFYEEMNVGNDIVIFGHTPTDFLNVDRSFSIWRKNHKICIDCGAAYGGKLACLCLDTMQEFYVDSKY